MLWKFRSSSMTIPAELHDKIARSCAAIDQVPSEVVRVRSKKADPRERSKKQVSPAEPWTRDRL